MSMALAYWAACEGLLSWLCAKTLKMAAQCRLWLASRVSCPIAALENPQNVQQIKPHRVANVVMFDLS
jgi:hypothetical protein